MTIDAQTSTDTILYERRGRVGLITLNRPDRLNAMLADMGPRYAELLREADADPEVRAIVVTGAGRGFCSGADLSSLSAGIDALTQFVDGQSSDTLPSVALKIGTPVATAINGPCAGIGFVLGISADTRFAAPTATFSSSFSRLGLIAEYGSAWLLTRLVGLSTATDMLLTGRTVNAEQALAMGLVNEIADDVLARALAWADDVAENCSPTATSVIKRQLQDAYQQTLSEASDVSLREMRASFERPDLAEAMAARVEKRPVQFAPRTP